MPGYQTSGSITALYPGDSKVVFSAETPTSGTASLQVALSQAPGGTPTKLSMEIAFAAAPGAFEYDLETSDTDSDADYVPESTTVTTVNAGFVGRAEFPNIIALFARVRAKTQNANGVASTVKLTR